jgi:hypothetical protein
MEPTDLVVAGYVLAVPADAPPNDGALPAKLLTISDCIMDDLPRPEFWDWFLDLEEVTQIRTAAAPQCDVIHVGMRRSEVQNFVQANGGPDQPYLALVNRHQSLTASVLGYEIVGAELTLDFHSWHCHGYADEARDQLGIRVNDLGLLGSWEDATRVLDWMLDLPADQAPAPVDWWVVALARD